MKKVLNAILILAMLFSMFGCAEAPSPDPSQIDSNSHPNSEGVFPPELEPVGISQEEASERGGLFVKTAENRYLPLQNNIDIGANNDHLFLTLPDEEYVPVLGDSCDLVLFSSNKPKNIYVMIPVLREGFTGPYFFSETRGEIYAEYASWENRYNFWQADALREATNTYYGISAVVEEIDGKSFEDFFKENTFDTGDYCSSQKCSYNNIWDAVEGETITYGFFAGTKYTELQAVADLKYYIIDGCEKLYFQDYSVDNSYKAWTGVRCEASLTKEGYAIIDTSTLENGKYVVPGSVIGIYGQKFLFEVNR